MATTADPRKLLAASRKSRRIVSPYASYSLAGALFCNICSNTPIKSESLWESHVASSQHKTNVARKGNLAASKGSNKRPAETDSVADDTDSAGAAAAANGSSRGTTANKRVKTANPDFKNLTLPVGFFDDSDGDGDEQGGNVSRGEEVVEPDDEEEAAASSAKSKLPADFFSSSSSKPKAASNTVVTAATDDDLDDEWAAFQADIATAEQEVDDEPMSVSNAAQPGSHTISAPAVSAADIAAQNQADQTGASASRNARSAAEEELEDAKAAMVEFFDEQSTFEERVQKLKERREMLRQAGNTDAKAPTPVTSFATPATAPPERMQLSRSNSVPSVKMGGVDDVSMTGESNTGQGASDDDEDEDFEDDEDMFFRRR